MVPELAASLAIGFLGSLHCLGMCGPLVLAYSLRTGRQTLEPPRGCSLLRSGGLPHQAVFHLGRLATYGTLGALAAGLLNVAELSRLFSGMRLSVSLLGGILLILMGAVLLRAVPLPKSLAELSRAQGAVATRLIPAFARSGGFLAGLGLGCAAGLIPCCLSWSALIAAATTEHPLEGLLVMTAFWLGTLPALLLAGLSSSFLSARVRLLGERAASLLVIASGLVLISRGTGILV